MLNNKPRETLKHILISILVGACVAFLSSLFEGALHVLEGYGNDIVGGASATVAYFKTIRWI